ncbi:unnamed protein product [Thelazia callipaeda]|uniref:Tetraspanin n=1 Tax=Thelazia callipaeda TaxID=103827 RepID=A0A0N5CQB5_THECL|nr:unnamed protein product [Thelazia callipaeda]
MKLRFVLIMSFYLLVMCSRLVVKIFIVIDPSLNLQAPTLYIYVYGMIIHGIYMIVVALIGCCGSSRESPVLLTIYVITVSVIVACTMSSAVYLIFIKSNVDAEISNTLAQMVQNYYRGSGIITESLDRLQQAFQCCGNAGCSDFRLLQQDIPHSCDIRCDGCSHRIMLTLRIGFSIAFLLQLIAIVAGLFLIIRSKRSWNQRWLIKIDDNKNKCKNNSYWYLRDCHNLDSLRNSYYQDVVSSSSH